jgi:PBP1b-binding outer membrane lipoprotein LpoB
MKTHFTLSAVAVLTLLLCGCQESIDERIAREAKDYTQRNCPNRMGDNIIVDSMTYDAQTRTITYHYTFGEKVDTALVNENREEITSTLNKNVKEDLTTKFYKENDINFRYLYRTSDGRDTVLNIFFTPEDYK